MTVAPPSRRPSRERREPASRSVAAHGDGDPGRPRVGPPPRPRAPGGVEPCDRPLDVPVRGSGHRAGQTVAVDEDGGHAEAGRAATRPASGSCSPERERRRAQGRRDGRGDDAADDGGTRTRRRPGAVDESASSAETARSSPAGRCALSAANAGARPAARWPRRPLRRSASAKGIKTATRTRGCPMPVPRVAKRARRAPKPPPAHAGRGGG